MRVAVIGAGPAGMTAAYALTKAGVEVDLFEASPRVGGMARTLSLWGQKVDLGPHRFFSSDRRVNELWLEVVGPDYAMVRRLTRIYYRGRFFDYPLRAGNALLNLGPWEASRCVASYARERLRGRRDEGTFESWVVGRFGRRLFEIFFQAYSEKLWGIPCSELDADFAAQRIKKLSLYEAVKNALFHGRGNEHATLVDTFAYPNEGTGMVYERMAAFVRGRGRIHLETPVEQVVTEQGRVTGLVLRGGERKAFDHVISSMPLTLLVQRLEEAPPEVKAAVSSLTFRNTILVYLKVEGSALFPDNWIYIHSSDLRAGRVTNFRNWGPGLNQGEPASILAVEYWCNFEDELWTWPEERLVALARDEIRRTGLVGDAAISEGHVERIPRCYPVYARGYRARLEKVEDYLRTVSGLSVIGRYGAFKYNNQDHGILMGLLAAENLVASAGHDLWGVNTDYESYQEACVITETGLQKRAS